jgi:chemotaxis protein CheX
MTRVVQLPEKLDTSAASKLLIDISANRGKPLVLDASCVRKIGALCGHILISTILTWRNDGQNLKLRDFGEIANDLTLLGLSEQFGIKDAHL